MRSTVYFACIGGVVAGSIALRVLSPSAPVIAPLADVRLSGGAGPRDFVVQPWVAPGEKTTGPARIISLAPSITETLCALGLRSRLIGRTQYCTWPPDVASVEIVGALTDASLERITALRPDVIFTTENSGELNRKLREVGLHVEPAPHESIEDVYTAIARVGDLCGRPITARALIGSIVADMDRLTRSAAAKPHTATRVLITLEMKLPPQTLYVAGPQSFLGTLLKRAGYANAAQSAGIRDYRELPLEQLAQVNPDVIVDFGPLRTPAEQAAMYSAWSQVPGLSAIAGRRVISFGGQAWLSAGPRIAVELDRLITVLDPHGQTSRPG